MSGDERETARRGRAPLRKANLATLAHDEIHRRIMVGVMKEGEKIVLMDLAAELGTSIIPVREALARLTAERLVRYEQNKGFSVAPAPNAEEIANLFEARLVMELGALELGLARMGRGTVEALRAINDRIRAQSYGAHFEDFQGFIQDNAEFHEILIALTNNPLILDAYRKLGYHERIPLTLHGRGVQDIERIVAEHDAIIAALEARDLEAARAALKAHILDAYERLPVPHGDHALRPLKASMPAR